MKTTVEITDSLLERAKRQARMENRTLREVLEEALRLHLQRVRSRSEPFRLKRHTMKGRGVQPGIREGDWETIRDLIYSSGPERG